MVPLSCPSLLGKWRQQSPWSSLTNHPSQINQLQWEAQSKLNAEGNPEEMPSLDIWLPEAHVDTSTHVHMHTHPPMCTRTHTHTNRHNNGGFNYPYRKWDYVSCLFLFALCLLWLISGLNHFQRTMQSEELCFSEALWKHGRYEFLMNNKKCL